MKTKIPQDWKMLAHPNGHYSFWHPPEWFSIKPPSETSFLALHGGEKAIMLEVFVFGTGHDSGSAKKMGGIMDTLLVKKHGKVKHLFNGPYQPVEGDEQEAQIHQSRQFGPSLAAKMVEARKLMNPPERGFRLTAEVMDQVTQPQKALIYVAADYFSLHGNGVVLQLNFKTMLLDHPTHAPVLETLVSSLRIGPQGSGYYYEWALAPFSH